jgi:hypothetical protein
MFTDGFLQTVMQLCNSRVSIYALNTLAHSRRICSRFYRYLGGSTASNMLLLISRTQTFFLTCWLFRKYFLLSLRIYIHGITQNVYHYLTLLKTSGSALSHRLYMLLHKIASLYIDSARIADELYIFSTDSVRIILYVSMVFCLSTFMHKMNARFFLFAMNVSVFSIHSILKQQALFNIIRQIEHTLFTHNNVRHFFIARFYHHSIPQITNAKIVCEYILIHLCQGRKIKEIYNKIFRWQRYWQRRHDNGSSRSIRKFGINIGQFMYPLKGIRIICSGPPYKARRTTASKYHTWVSNEFITGKMPLSTMDLSIDYYQSVAVIRRSNIGIKVWLLFDDVL